MAIAIAEFFGQAKPSNINNQFADSVNDGGVPSEPATLFLTVAVMGFLNFQRNSRI
jgi:hypothetical protein